MSSAEVGRDRLQRELFIKGALLLAIPAVQPFIDLSGRGRRKTKILARQAGLCTAIALALTLSGAFNAFVAAQPSSTTLHPVTLSPAPLRFGGVLANTSSTAQTVLLRNTQSVSLNISSITTGSREFVEDNDCPNTLPARGTCNISVRFVPTAQRNFATSLTVTDDASTSPQPVGLIGNGVLPISESAFKHIVVMIQENRTPDNLFHALCTPPYGSAQSCSTSPSASQYNIQTRDWLNKFSPTGVTQPGAVPLADVYDLSHSNSAFVSMCDRDSSGVCRMDRAATINCGPNPGSCPPNPQFQFVDNSTGILNPYLDLATQYGWANYMFQTNQGPSGPAHLYLFGATAAPSKADDAAGIFVVANELPGKGAGCISPADTKTVVLQPDGTHFKLYPCYEHLTLPDVLPSNVTWRYYVGQSQTGPWNAPIAIRHICKSTGPGGTCTGQQWTDNIDHANADVLNDIAQCHLRSLSFVIPTGGNSDHPSTGNGGPSWVASVVNAIGNSTSCDGGAGYWNNTAILITWDDWGGWYDHEPPTILTGARGDAEQGFRVPLLVVSAYTPAGYIGNNRIDFGSILRFIEGNYGIQRGALGFADARATHGLSDFFDRTMAPRTFTTIQAPLSAEFFLHDRRPPLPPDDD